MSGIVGLFASIGEHIPILNKEKFGQPNPEGKINAMHYRGTCLLILVMCLLVTSSEWISGTGAIIDCLHNGAIPGNVINTYCYIMGTFTLPRKYFDGQVGFDVSDTGVGPYNSQEDKDYIEVKAYYQWVPFVLFLQALMFYIPHIIFKIFEGGKIKLVIAGLQQWVLKDEDRHSKEEELATYIVETKGTHWGWCLRILGASLLYLVNVVGQIFFTDCFLGYEFSIYGVSAASFLEENIDQHERIDPMAKVFPRMAKCTFQKYGPSGTIQKHDAQCVLPINIINEKIYVFLWFWFCFLALITAFDVLWTSLIIFNKTAWKIIMHRKLRMSPKKNYNPKINLNLIIQNIDFGDWKLIYQLMRNMDALVFMEFLEHLTEKLEDNIEELNGKNDTLKLKDFLDEDKKPNTVYGDRKSVV